jgi:hypothetical protein
MANFYENKKRMFSEINRVIELFKRNDKSIDHDKFVDEIRIAFGVGDTVILDYFELLSRKGIIKIEEESKSNPRLLIVPLVEQIRLTDDRISEEDVSQ